MTPKVDTPYRTEYAKAKPKNLKGLLPGRAVVIVLKDRARFNNADDIQTVIEYLRNVNENGTISEDDGTVADECGTTCNSSGRVEVGRDSEPGPWTLHAKQSSQWELLCPPLFQPW